MAKRDTIGIDILVWISRVLVGVLFMISGLIKVNDIIGFSYKLVEYFDVFHEKFGFPNDFFNSFSVGLAGFISVFEVAVAIFLILGVWRKGTTLSLLLMIIFFTLLTGYSAITNTVTDCGCFGDAVKLTPVQSFIKDLVLLFFIGILYYFQEHIYPIFRNAKIAAGISGALNLVVLILTYYCYAHLPIIDFRPACPCCDVKYHTTSINDKGDNVLQNYIPTEDDCKVDALSGTALWVIIQHVKHASEADMKAALKLGAEVQAANIKVVGITATGSDDLAAFKSAYQPAFCFSQQDEKFPKTIIRSSPGFLLLKDGVVLKQWHINDLPTAADVQTAAQNSCNNIIRKGKPQE